MIDLKSLTYRYPEAAEAALRELDLQVDEGEFLVVAGPSGCGKSSLLRVFNGLIPHFHGGVLSGRVSVFGLDPIQLGPRGMSGSVGFVHQNPESHFVTRIVEDELAFAMENHGVAPPNMLLRVEEVLDQLAIAHLRHREIETLSGGERQRVAIAGVLTLKPRLLVLDEPTSQLDPQSTEEVLAALRSLNDDLGLTLVIAEHRLERVAQYADRILLLESGRQQRLGPPGEALPGSPLAPPLVQLCDAFGWQPASLTLKATRQRPEFRQLDRRSTPTSLERAGETTGAGVEKSASPAIEAQGLWWTYPGGSEVLKDLSFSVPRGTLTALIGRNGAGKSTVLKTLVGLIRPETGRVRLRPALALESESESESEPEPDRVVDPHQLDLDRVARVVGFVPQNPSRLLFHDSVGAELEWSLAQRQSRGSEAQDELRQLVAALGIADLEDRHPRELSTGERQRVALATALAGSPPILLLDEPTRGLDVVIKDRLADWLCRLRERGTTILLATHDVELVARCADRVILLGDGRLVTEGVVRDILHGSPVFGTQINRLFGDPSLQTLSDVRQRYLAAPEGPAI